MLDLAGGEDYGYFASGAGDAGLGGTPAPLGKEKFEHVFFAHRWPVPTRLKYPSA